MTERLNGFTLRGVEAKQHGRRLLIGAISAKELAGLYEVGLLVVDVYSSINPDGYQRNLSTTRSRKFGRFIQDREKGISPTSILIYSRNPSGGILEASPNLYQISYTGISDPQLFICDGQHRTDGFSEAFKEGWLSKESEFDVPVTILFWDPERSPKDQRLEEALQFYTINTQQKRMRTDLAHEYIFKQFEADEGPIGNSTKLKRMKKREYIPYNIFIAKRLRTDADNPWKDNILEPNASGVAPISQGSFTDSLAPIMDYATKANLTMGDILNLLKSYWEAIFELCQDAFSDPASHVLMKTAGVFSLHIFLPVLLIRKPNLGVSPSVSQFTAVLSSVGECFTDEFWTTDKGEASTFGTGKKSFQELADFIIERIP